MKQFIALLVLCIMVACSGVAKPDKPDNLIPEKKMTSILYDISLINGLRTANTARLKTSGIDPEKFIYDKYGVDSTQVAQSIAYYSVDFSCYNRMWESIRDRMQFQLDSVQEVKKVNDSINREKRLREQNKIDGQDTVARKIAPVLQQAPKNDSIL